MTVEDILALREVGLLMLKDSGVELQFGPPAAPVVEVTGPAVPQPSIPNDVAALLSLSDDERASRILQPGEIKVPRNLVGLWNRFLEATNPDVDIDL